MSLSPDQMKNELALLCRGANEDDEGVQQDVQQHIGALGEPDEAVRWREMRRLSRTWTRR